MIYHYDLHIHSVLSPCADVLMTPHNIFNMAYLKGLDMIAVTDHNTTKQLKVCHELSKSYDMLFIPGVELTLKEDFDVLCYFRNIEDAIRFDDVLDLYRTHDVYDEAMYGEQALTNMYDETIDYYPYLLTKPLRLSIFDLKKLLKPYPHVLIYAHIDKGFRSGLKYIHQVELDGIEYQKKCLDNLDVIWLKNSDAHQIVDISEKALTNQINLEHLDIDSFMKVFKHD